MAAAESILSRFPQDRFSFTLSLCPQQLSLNGSSPQEVPHYLQRSIHEGAHISDSQDGFELARDRVQKLLPRSLQDGSSLRSHRILLTPPRGSLTAQQTSFLQAPQKGESRSHA